MKITEFGGTKEIFVNQDEGMFVALPITFDENTLELELDESDGRKIVKAGSVVKEVVEGVTYVKGITAEPYDITYGPVVGRVVVEGYAWASRLTDAAKEAAPLLPRIVLYPVAVPEPVTVPGNEGNGGGGD